MSRGEPLFRQWRLLKTLQAHRFGIAADEFAGRLGCTKRTIQRDLSVLQDVGFPISFEQRDYGKKFWKLATGFIESDKLALSMTEMLSLHLGQQLLAPLAGTQFGDGLSSALEKIKGLLPHKALGYFSDLEGTILVKNIASQDYTRQAKEIRILNEAVLAERVVKLVYRSASRGEQVATHFHPYGMVLLGATLYCIGLLENYGEIRTLKVTRICGVELTGQTFERPDTFSLAAHTRGSFGVFGPGKLQTIRAKFTGWAATNVREQTWHHSQKIIKDADDGKLTAEFELSSTVEFKRWLLGFGRHAVVLKPKKLAMEIAEELKKASGGYGKGPSHKKNDQV